MEPVKGAGSYMRAIDTRFSYCGADQTANARGRLNCCDYSNLISADKSRRLPLSSFIYDFERLQLTRLSDALIGKFKAKSRNAH